MGTEYGLSTWLLLFGTVLFLLLMTKWVFDTVVFPFLVMRDLRRQGIPSPPFRPVIGQLPVLRQAMQAALSPTRAGEDDAKFYRPWAAWAAEYGPIYAICFGASPRLVLTDATLIKEVLTAPPHVYTKTPMQRLDLSFLGNGLVNSGGAFWQRQRKMVNPAFSHTNIKKMTVAMIESTVEEVAALKSRVPSSHGGSEVEVGFVLSLLALTIIGRTAFGADIGGGSDDAKRVSSALTHLIDGVLQLALGGYRLIPFYSWLPTPLNRSMAASEREITRTTLAVIQRRRKARGEGVEGEDLLASMLTAVDDATNEGMTDRQLMDECVTFLLAGHETTAQLLTWTMYLLALHPEWQEKLREEARGPITEERLSSLPLHHCVLLESLRLFPPVPAIVRHVAVRTQLGRYSLPCGMGIHIPFGMLHFNKEWWGEDADCFRPQRFADGMSAACKEPMAFLPFSHGPRNCVGQAFALIEAKIILSHLLGSFSWTLSPGYVHSMQVFFTLRPAKGMYLNLVRI